MSEIDCFDHEYVGAIAGLPIYHPTQDLKCEDGTWPFGENVGPQNLLIGGGSGEHPAIVVRDLGVCVAVFTCEAVAEYSYNSHAIATKILNYNVDLFV